MNSKCDSAKTIDENNLVTKSNRLIEAAYKLTEIEQKIVLTLISLVEPGDTKFRSFTFAIKDFIKLIGAKSEKRYRELENITATLLSKVHHIRFEDGLTQVQWLSRADYNYKQGTITLTLNEFLEPYLLDLKREFTSYQLKNVSKLKGHYAIRIYELLKQYERLKERMFDLDDLRHKLGTEDIYPAYANFKQRVLVPAQKQINQKSDIDIIFKEIKEGRSVRRIKFLVSSKNTIIQPLTIIEEVEDKQEIIDMDLQELTEEEKIKEEQQELNLFTSMEEEDIKEIYKLGIEFGFKARKNIIKNWLKDYSKENIIKIIKLVTNKIENPVGFISYKLKNELDEEEEFIQLSSEEQAIAEFFSEKMPKVKRPKYETVPDWILKPDAIEIFSKYMSVSEAEKLWKEKGRELTRMINNKQEEMSTSFY